MKYPRSSAGECDHNHALIGYTTHANLPKRLAPHVLARTLYLIWPHTRHARAPTSLRSTGFCVICCCISSSSSSSCDRRNLHRLRVHGTGFHGRHRGVDVIPAGAGLAVGPVVVATAGDAPCWPLSLIQRVTGPSPIAHFWACCCRYMTCPHHRVAWEAAVDDQMGGRGEQPGPAPGGSVGRSETLQGGGRGRLRGMVVVRRYQADWPLLTATVTWT